MGLSKTWKPGKSKNNQRAQKTHGKENPFYDEKTGHYGFIECTSFLIIGSDELGITYLLIVNMIFMPFIITFFLTCLLLNPCSFRL